MAKTSHRQRRDHDDHIPEANGRATSDEQQTGLGDQTQDLPLLVWKYFGEEIQEILAEIATAMRKSRAGKERGRRREEFRKK